MKTDNDIRVAWEQRPKNDIELKVGMPITSYGLYWADSNTLIDITYYKSGSKKDQIKHITLALDEYMGEDNWNTRLDCTTTYAVETLDEVDERGNKYYFCELNKVGHLTRGSYNRPCWTTLGLGYREDYVDYHSEYYLSM
jgi:hypothetical protein